MAKTTNKSITNAKRKDLPRQPQDLPVVTGSRIQGGLQDTELKIIEPEEWSKEFDR